MTPPALRRLLVAVSCVMGAAVGCTTLGPMPATTALSSVPAGRPSAEVTFGTVPGFYLSSGTQASPEGASLIQGSLLVEPDRLIHVPGVVVGVRHIGDSKNGGFYEPLAGYRVRLDGAERISASAVAYFTKASGARDGASYRATRGGAEVGFDVRATPTSRWFELHAHVSAALTGLSAKGRYCLDSTGQHGADCGDPPVASTVTDASASGLYPSATVGISLDFARHLGIFFHGGRLGLLFAGGTMPTLISGQQQDAHWYGAAGAALTLSFGSTR